MGRRRQWQNQQLSESKAAKQCSLGFTLICHVLTASPGLQLLIRQRGCSQGVLWRLEAEALMEVEEVRQGHGFACQCSAACTVQLTLAKMAMERLGQFRGIGLGPPRPSLAFDYSKLPLYCCRCGCRWAGARLGSACWRATSRWEAALVGGQTGGI